MAFGRRAGRGIRTLIICLEGRDNKPLYDTRSRSYYVFNDIKGWGMCQEIFRYRYTHFDNYR